MSVVTPPRLLVVAPAAYPFGGVATWLDGLVAGLRGRGWPVEVALLAGFHHDVDRYLERHPLGVVRRVECATGSRQGRLRALVRLLEESRSEIVLSVNVGDIEDAVDRFRRKRRGALRLITAQHGLQRDFYDHLASRAKVVDRVVAVNRLGCELARAYSGLPSERIDYAPCGVEIDPAVRAQPVGDTLRIVWAGRIEQPQKRAGDLPGICARLTELGVDFQLVVAGSGPEEESLAAALSPYERDGRVRRLGEVSAARMRQEVYSRADLLLITSSWETGPIVAWEAMAAGLTVVSSRFLGSGREAALRHDETALLFSPGDVVAAASALARATDRELRARLAEAGMTEVGARYGLAASVEAWAQGLLGALAQPPRPARAAGLPVTASGRLDRWLGPAAGESVRSTFGVRYRQRSAGAEWPHVLVGRGDEAEFFRLAAALDEVPGSSAVAAR